MSVTAASTSVLLGATMILTATVTNTTDVAVGWTVNGIPGGNAQVGTISSGGLFTAPQILPSPATMNIQAASVADPTKTAGATISIVSDVSVTLAPASAAIELGAQQLFQVGIVSAGNPSSLVTWELSGFGCAGATCGAISSVGLFIAPQTLPLPPTVTLTAISIADPSKRATVAITITSNFTFTISGPPSVAVAAIASLSATLTPVPNSEPNPAISWSVSGAGCAGATCGALSGSGATATYIAPTTAPSPNIVTVTATPAAAPLKAASLAIQITAPALVTVLLSPANATVSLNDRQTFTAQVQNTSNAGVTWNVNGVAGGSSTFGQVCVVGSSPCQPVTSTDAGSIDYVAPFGVPSPNPLTLSAVSQANTTDSAGSAITIIPHVIVSVSPPSVTLVPGASQSFTAMVEGTADQQVTWTITGTACSAGAPCGTINAAGLYRAPAVVPSPNALSVVATSAEDSSRTASSAITVTAQPTILSLLPSSATAGAAGGFTLLVQGANFVPGGPGPGSAIFFDGNQRNTTCASASNCSTLLSSADVALATNPTVTIQNPDGTLSNTVVFVVVAATSGPENIPLAPGAPNATANDIIVTDLSTDGSSLPAEDVSLSIVALGPFLPTTNTCTLGGAPVTFAVPGSGQTTADLCAFSMSGLDPSYSYTLSGPSPNDMLVVGEAPLGLGIVQLTIQLSSTTATGARTLFIQNANLDVTTATGVIDVE